MSSLRYLDLPAHVKKDCTLSPSLSLKQSNCLADRFATLCCPFISDRYEFIFLNLNKFLSAVLFLFPLPLSCVVFSILVPNHSVSLSAISPCELQVRACAKRTLGLGWSFAVRFFGFRFISFFLFFGFLWGFSHSENFECVVVANGNPLWRHT